MTKDPITGKEPPFDKAAERLKQFEDSRKPQSPDDGSENNEESQSKEEETENSNEKPDR